MTVDFSSLQVLSNGEWVDATPIPDTLLFLRRTISLQLAKELEEKMKEKQKRSTRAH
jgi:hypothetical protein